MSIKCISLPFTAFPKSYVNKHLKIIFSLPYGTYVIVVNHAVSKKMAEH